MMQSSSDSVNPQTSTKQEFNTKQQEKNMMSTSNSLRPDGYKKSGVVRYYVTTDTHGYPWGFRNGVNGRVVDFDLGDNTAGCENVYLDPPETMSVARKIALRGNHDTYVQRGKAVLELQVYKDEANQIIVFGLDTGTTALTSYSIPENQIKEMLNDMKALGDNWDVIVLTHVPLFDGNSSIYGKCLPSGSFRPANTDKLFQILKAFKERSTGNITLNGVSCSYNFSKMKGYVIGCFAGHTHCAIKQNLDLGGGCLVPTEVFTTNGADEYTIKEHYHNEGLYVPYETYINVNLEYGTVNGVSFEAVLNDRPIDVRVTYVHPKEKCPYLSLVAGPFKMNANSTYYPKFYDGHYLGYTTNPEKGIEFGYNLGPGRYWPFAETTTLYAGGKTYNTRSIWFDTYGRLRYYCTDASNMTTTENYAEIEGYDSITVTFTTGKIHWTFQNGLLVSAEPTYKSGTLAGLNNYAIKFNNSGVPTGMTHNGSDAPDYGAGQNWMNVHNIRYYGTAATEITSYPQLGITGTFSSNSRINLIRSTSSGSNQVPDPTGILVRVVGTGNAAPVWLYNGKLTNLTDADLKL